MRYPSAEIRWFFKGQPKRDLQSWFRQSWTEVGTGERTDYYLLGTGETLNIKLREGRVEAKQRLWAEPEFVMRGSIAGQREGWVKWSFDLSEAGQDVQLASRHAEAWLPVHKRRWMRTFIPEHNEITETDAGSYPAAGCNAELTFVKAGEEDWYTLGLESFGEGRDLKGLLHSIGSYFFDADFPLLLTPSNSRSYAAWIEHYFVKQ